MEGVQENIINSQESVITEDGIDSNQAPMINVEGKLSDPAVTETNAMEAQPERRSECLQKDIHLTTLEKNEDYAKKRCMEGNSDTSHSLSRIENAQLNDLAKNMCVVIHDANFATFDIIKDLEAARNFLYNKHKKPVVETSCDSVVFNLEKKLF